MRDVLFATIHDLLSAGNELSLLLGDLGIFQARHLMRDFPSRIYNVGILEPSMVSFAGGLSRGGIIPILYSITPFITERSLEQIKLEASYNCNKIVLLSAGGTCDYTDLGPTHHCPSDIAILDNYSNIAWFTPFTSSDADSFFRNSLNKLFLSSSYYRLSTTSESEVELYYLDKLCYTVDSAKNFSKFFSALYIDIGPDSIYMPELHGKPDSIMKVSSSIELDRLSSCNFINSCSFSSITIRCPFYPPISLFNTISNLIMLPSIKKLHLSYPGQVHYDQVVTKTNYFGTTNVTLQFK